MDKFLLKNASDLDNSDYKNARINLDRTEDLVPVQFPCIAVIAYAGAGWDEIDFIYQKDFLK